MGGNTPKCFSLMQEDQERKIMFIKYVELKEQYLSSNICDVYKIS